MTDTTFDLADSLTCGHPLTSSPFCPQCGAEVSSAQRNARFGRTAEAHPPGGMTTTGGPLLGAPAPLDNSRAWLLAVAPLLSLCISAGLLFSGFSHATLLGIAIAIGVNTLIAVWDSRFLKGHGYDVSTTLAVFLVPVYLLRRSRVLGHHQAPLATWIAVFIVAFAGDAILSSRFATIDMSVVEAQIREDLELDASANVVCPGKAVHAVKSTFMCEVSDSQARAMVQVKVEDSDGSLTWEVVGAKLASTGPDFSVQAEALEVPANRPASTYREDSPTTPRADTEEIPAPTPQPRQAATKGTAVSNSHAIEPTRQCPSGRMEGTVTTIREAHGEQGVASRVFDIEGTLVNRSNAPIWPEGGEISVILEGGKKMSGHTRVENYSSQKLSQGQSTSWKTRVMTTGEAPISATVDVAWWKWVDAEVDCPTG